MKIKDVPKNGLIKLMDHPSTWMVIRKVNGTVDILEEGKLTSQLLHYCDQLDWEVEYLGQGRLTYTLEITSSLP